MPSNPFGRVLKFSFIKGGGLQTLNKYCGIQKDMDSWNNSWNVLERSEIKDFKSCLFRCDFWLFSSLFHMVNILLHASVTYKTY